MIEEKFEGSGRGLFVGLVPIFASREWGLFNPLFIKGFFIN